MADAPSPSELDRKIEFVVQEAQTRLDNTLTAYDAICGKATTLLSVAMPLITSLFAYCIVSFDLGSPLFYAAMVYAILLSVGTVPLWKILNAQKMAHAGHKPSDYLNAAEFKTLSLSEIWLKICHFYESDIEKNEGRVADSARLLRSALTILGWATLSGLLTLAIGSTIHFFAGQDCRGLHSPAHFQKHIESARHR